MGMQTGVVENALLVSVATKIEGMAIWKIAGRSARQKSMGSILRQSSLVARVREPDVGGRVAGAVSDNA